MKSRLFLLLFISGLLLTSCNEMITYPAITSPATNVHHPGQFVWHDLVSPNPKASMDFYSAVFGWSFTTLGEGNEAYYVVKNNGNAIGGIVKLDPQYGSVGEWVASLSVSDVPKAVDYNENKGGKTLMKPMNVKGRGKVALIQDPQGAIISFIFSDSGDPAVEAGKIWLWNELWSNDMTQSMDYYKGLIPYTTEKLKIVDTPYYIFKNGGKKLSGIMKNPVQDMRTSWIPYIRVSNINDVVNKAKNAGAHIISEPKPEIRNGTLAIIQDPSGAKFALQEYK